MAVQLSPSGRSLCMVALAIIGFLCFIRPSNSDPDNIQYYVQAYDNSSANIVNAVNPAASTFGLTTTFAYPITKKANATSTVLGSVRGLEAFDSFDPNYITILVLNTITYKDDQYDGTISLHGQANTALTKYEITIVGGTGDFRGVKGYAFITNLGIASPDRVFKHSLHFVS